jgi:hypothetical protein
MGFGFGRSAPSADLLNLDLQFDVSIGPAFRRIEGVPVLLLQIGFDNHGRAVFPSLPEFFAELLGDVLIALGEVHRHHDINGDQVSGGVDQRETEINQFFVIDSTVVTHSGVVGPQEFDLYLSGSRRLRLGVAFRRQRRTCRW